MKTRYFRRPLQGFTLVELLVVIAIIAVLAAMGFAGAQAAINKAKKIKASKVAAAMDQAVLGFYDEYGHLPGLGDASSDTKMETDSGEGRTLVTILLGYEGDSDPENKKKVRYFEAPEAKGSRDGIKYSSDSGNSIEGLYDPWGGPYVVMLDGDYDNEIDSGTNTLTGKPLRGRRVATYTLGKNDKDDNGSKDDVKSW